MSRVRRPALIACALLGILAPGAIAAPPQELSARLQQLSYGELTDAPPVEQADAVSLLANGPGSLMRDGNSLVVNIRVVGSARDRIDGVREAGGRILAVSVHDDLIEAAVDEENLPGVANLAGVEAVTEVLTPMTGAVGGGAPGASGAINTCAPGIVSEGDAQLRSGAARTQFDVDGTGVKVGVLSNSFNRGTMSTKQPNDVASGDLPGATNPCGRTTAVQVIDDTAPVPGGGSLSDEGRAMAQIVHDVAPGANLAFATASTGDVNFANNIRALADAGAKVIADDVIYFDEPFFQDGIIANAVTEVTSEDAVAYFSMAFNDNRVIGGNDSNSWESPAYRPTACPAIPTVAPAGDCMDFDPGPGVDNTFNITAVPGRRLRFDLQWAQPQNGVTTNLDLFVISAAEGATPGISQDVNSTTGKPFEFSSFSPSNGTTGNYQLVIRRTGGGGTPRVKWINGDNGAGSIAGLEYPTSAGGDIVGPTIFGHNGTAAAQTIGAVPFNNAATMEASSSRGPVTHYFAPVSGSAPASALASPEVLSKPDVSATDGGINSFFPAPCTTCRFFGTSAATPHAAGVAALQWDAKPTATVAQIKAAQKTSGRPVGGFGPLAAGAGLIDAVDAVGLTINPPGVPTVMFTAAPGLVTNNSQPIVEFTIAGRPNSVACSLDGGAAAACASPFVPAASLADGEHTLAVGSTDYFGQADGSSTSFTVDTVAPTTQFGKTPKKSTKKTKAKFTFSSSEPDSLFSCSLDRKGFRSCSSPAKFKVKLGKKHQLVIQAMDVAGNIGATSTYKWKTKKKKPRR